MLENLPAILAYGPPGGINGSVAVFWLVTWTVIRGTLLYGSVIALPAWVDLGPEAEHTHH